VPLPVPSPRTWSVNDLVSAALLNTNVRDAVTFLAGRPFFVGYQSTSQSVASGSTFHCSIDTNLVDTYNGHSTTTNNYRYTAQVPGWYRLEARVGWPNNATTASRYILGWALNGSTTNVGRADTPNNNNGSGGLTADIDDYMFLNAGDGLDLLIFQSSAGALSLTTGSRQTQMAVTWVHS
jgi:hypothetical protein